MWALANSLTPRTFSFGNTVLIYMFLLEVLPASSKKTLTPTLPPRSKAGNPKFLQMALCKWGKNIVLCVCEHIHTHIHTHIHSPLHEALLLLYSSQECSAWKPSIPCNPSLDLTRCWFWDCDRATFCSHSGGLLRWNHFHWVLSMFS